MTFYLQSKKIGKTHCPALKSAKKILQTHLEFEIYKYQILQYVTIQDKEVLCHFASKLETTNFLQSELCLVTKKRFLFTGILTEIK